MPDLTLRMLHTANITTNGMGDPQQKVTLQAATGKDGTPNAEWSKWTPSGTLEFTITNAAAFDRLKPGKDYIVTLTEATD